MKQNVAIIIPVFNGLKHLQKNLPIILDQVRKIKEWNFKIIVTDDHSTDGTTDWLNNQYPYIVVIQGNGSLWWSGGINRGVEYALNHQEFRYVLLWNHDTICSDDYFEQLREIIASCESNTIIASKVYFLARPDVIFNHGCFFNPRTGRNIQHGYGISDNETFNSPVTVDWTGGMGTLIPVEVFQRIGLFDEKNFPQYYGDCDFFLRAKGKGFQTISYPALKIWNDKSNSGLEHSGKWGLFLKTLFSIKSNHNIVVQLKFLLRHARSPLAYAYFLYDFGIHFGSFLKHWVIGLYKKTI